MSDEIVIADLLLAVDVDRTPETVIDRAVTDIQQRFAQRKITVDVGLGTAGRLRSETKAAGDAVVQAASDTQKRIDSLFQQSGAKARSSAEGFKQAYREQAQQEQAAKQAHQEGMQRLRQASATAQLNARLSAQAEREAQQVVRAALRERTEMLDQVKLAHARARAEYDKESGQARGYGERTAAALKYRQAVREIEEGMTALGKRTDITTKDLTQLAQLQQRLAREKTTLGGGVNTLGLSGNFSNALQANLPRLVTGLQNSATALSPSLGAAAAQISGLAVATNTAATASGFLGAAATGAAAGVGILGVAAVAAGQKAATFEGIMDDAKVSVGANAEEFKRLESAALNMGKGLGFGAIEAARGIEELGSQGLDATKVLDGGLIASMTLARATTGNLAQAAQVSAGALNAWKMNASELPGVADTISAAVNNTTLRMDNLRDGIAAGGSVAKSFGLSFREYLAILSLGTDAMLSASDAGTGLKTMFMALTPNSKEAAAIMRELKFTAFDAQGEFKGMETVVRELRAATADLTPEQRTMKLETLFGADAVRLINVLLDQGADKLRERTELLDQDGEAMRSAAEKMDNARGATQEWNRATEKLQITFVSGILPVFTKFLNEVATPLVDTISELVEKLNEVKSPGELKATLKIEAGDDTTTRILKFILGAGAGVTEATTTGNPILRAIARLVSGQGVQDLQKNLQKLDLIETPSTPGGAISQQRQIAADLPRYQQMLAEALGKNTEASQALLKVLAPDLGLPDSSGPTGTTSDPKTAGTSLGQTLAQAALKGLTGDTTAIANECSKWLRQVFQQAFPKAGRDLFGGTALETEQRFKRAGLTRAYTGPQDLQAGEFVFNANDKSGDGHGGIVVILNGKRYVAENSSVVAAASATGDARGLTPIERFGGITSVGNVNGYAPLGRTVSNNVPVGGERPPAAPKKSDEALLAEARRLLGRLETVTKEKDLTGIGNVNTALKTFEDSGPRASAALDLIRRELGKTREVASKFGEDFDALKGRLSVADSQFKLSGNTAAYAKSLDGITSAAEAAAAAEKKKNGETARYQALLDLAGDAAGKARSEREKLGREEEAAARDADTRAKNRARTQQDLQKALDDQREGDARRLLDQLKGEQAEALDLAKDDAAQRVRIVEQTGPAILAAEDRLIDARRGRRIRAAQQAADEAKLLPGADLTAIERTRRLAVGDAYREAAAERAKARQVQAAAERTADQTATREATQRATQRAELERKLAADLAAGRLTQAQARVEQLQQNLQTELAAHKNNAAERLRVEQELGPKVLAAQKRVLEAQRDQAIAAAAATAATERAKLTAEYGKGKEPKDLLAGIASTEATAVSTAESTFNTKLSALYSASAERINAATAAVQAKNRQLADQRLQIEEQVTRQLAGLNESQRQAEVQREQDALTRLQNDRQARIAAARGDAAALLQIERETAGAIQQQEERLALTRLVAAKRKAEDDKAAALAAVPKGATAAQRAAVEQAAEAQRLAAVSAAYRAYSLAVTQSVRGAAQVVADAQENETEKVRELRDAYSQAASGIREKIAAQKVDQSDLDAYLKRLDELDRAIEKAGVGANVYLQAARATAQALADQALDTVVASGAFENVAEGHTLAAQATARYTVTLEDALAQLPTGTEATERYVAVLEELARDGRVAAEVVQAVKQAIADRTVLWALEAEAIERVTDEGVKQADQLAELGDTEGAIEVLHGTLDDLYTRLENGEDVAAAIQLVIDKINGLSAALTLDTEFGSFVAGLGGTLSDQIDAVVEKLADDTLSPGFRARLKAHLAGLRADLAQAYPTPTGYTPGSPGFGQGGTGPGGLAAILQSDDLLARIEAETDPARLRELMEEAGKFLASGVAETLPAATRKGLEDGVKGAQDYLDLLGTITAEKVEDAVSRTQGTPPAPTNRFQEFSERLSTGDLRAVAEDEAALPGLIAGLEEAREQGQLTTAQLQLLKDIIAAINGEPLELGLSDQLYADTLKANVQLVAQLREGTLTVEDFAEQALGALPGLEKLAVAAERAGRPELAAGYREIAQELRELGGEALRTAELLAGVLSVSEGLASVFDGLGLTDFSKITRSAGQLFQTFQQGRKAFFEIGPAFAKSFGAGLGALGGFLGVVGTGINLIGQIGEAILNLSPGFQAWKKDLLEVAELQKRALGMDTGGFKSPWAKALEQDAANREKLANAGFWKRLWWGLTGSAPQVMKSEAARLQAELQTIFAELGSGISNAFTGAMNDAFLKGEMADWARNFDKTFDQQIGQLILKTMVTAALEQGAVANDLAALATAIKEQRYGDVPPILDRVKASGRAALSPVATYAPSLPGYGSGSEGGDGGSSSRDASLIGAPPQLQVGMATAVLGIPPELATGLQVLGGWDVALQNRTNQRVLELADYLMSGRGGGAPPATDLANFTL